MVPWLAVLDRAASLRRAAGLGLLLCEAFTLAVFAWFGRAVASYTGGSTWLGMAVLAVLAPLFLQPQFVIWAVARTLARSRGSGRIVMALIGGCAYVGAEWAAPKLFGDTLGHGLYASPLLRQAGDLAGAGGLTFLLLLGNECVLAALHALHAQVVGTNHQPAGTQQPHHRLLRTRFGAAPVAVAAPALALIALLGGLALYGAVRLRLLTAAPTTAPLTATVVQADISHYEALAAEIGTFDAVRTILDAYFALSAGALEQQPADLLVWPETVYPTTFGTPKSPDGAAFDRAIAGFVNDAGVPLVFGSYDAENGAEYNAAVFLAPSTDGRLDFDTYRKASLFPLTERVPAWLESEPLRRWLPWLGTWTPGRGTEVVTLALPNGRTLRVASLICYDAVDPRLALAAARAGAEVIVTLSNDSWFATGEGPHLHLIVSAFRSIETRRPQIRATNTGISAVIDATGALLGTIAVDRRATLTAAVTPERHAWTLMLAWGDWFGPTALVAAIVLLAITATRPR